MRNFEHINARSAAGAVKLLNTDTSFMPIAGGTDLLTQMKSGIAVPGRLVNLKTIPGLSDIRYDEDEGLELGPLATLDSIMANDAVKKHYPALQQAISLAASPQLRNFGTIGGNLVQASRCWYYRGQFNCWLKGGETCYARNGENSHHAIFGAGACNAVQPSDPAAALVALAADVTIAGPQSKQMMPLERFFQLPHLQSRQLTVLKPGEIILKITVPAPGCSQPRDIFEGHGPQDLGICPGKCSSTGHPRWGHSEGRPPRAGRCGGGAVARARCGVFPERQILG